MAAHVELAADGFSFLPFFEVGEPWVQYVCRSRHMSRGEGLADGIVPWTDLYGVVQGAVVARVSVRHRLTEALALTGGHIGYGVRRAYRRRGYATALLHAGLVIARDLGIDRGWSRVTTTTWARQPSPSGAVESSRTSSRLPARRRSGATGCRRTRASERRPLGREAVEASPHHTATAQRARRRMAVTVDRLSRGTVATVPRVGFSRG